MDLRCGSSAGRKVGQPQGSGSTSILTNPARSGLMLAFYEGPLQDYRLRLEKRSCFSCAAALCWAWSRSEHHCVGRRFGGPNQRATCSDECDRCCRRRVPHSCLESRRRGGCVGKGLGRPGRRTAGGYERCSGRRRKFPQFGASGRRFRSCMGAQPGWADQCALDGGQSGRNCRRLGSQPGFAGRRDGGGLGKR